MPPTQRVDVLVNRFVSELSSALESYAQDRAAAAIEEALGGALGNGSFRAARRGRPPGRPPGPGRAAAARRGRYKTVSAGRRLQGQYLGRLRALKGADRTRVKAVARKEGVAKAVRLANTLLRKTTK